MGIKKAEKIWHNAKTYNEVKQWFSLQNWEHIISRARVHSYFLMSLLLMIQHYMHGNRKIPRVPIMTLFSDPFAFTMR